MSVDLVFDPLLAVIQASESLWPEKSCEIHWSDDRSWCQKLLNMGPWGSTTLSGEQYYVELDINLPIRHVVEILAHELAHVAVGIDAGHGKEWEEAFSDIHRAYDDILESLESEAQNEYA